MMSSNGLILKKINIGFEFLFKKYTNIEGFTSVCLKTNHHPIEYIKYR